uniref:Uncharacterized protein n=1 Tax=Anguilla anguilla TaxID=7936 RepID=A0A0E9W0H1_ANGAN
MICSSTSNVSLKKRALLCSLYKLKCDQAISTRSTK